ncbi:MAG: hypothetical protein H0X26_03995 [Alphaproteobacteria bacterium]|nr:hypothetical protein [Alphaproteobacteria bacterium]
MNQRQKALQQIKKIAEENHLSWDDVSKALQVTSAKKDGGVGIEASEVLAYIGGILIFAGVGVYTTMFWQDLSSFLKIALTFGSGFSCYCVALGLSQNAKYNKVTQILFLMAAILEPMGLYVFLNEIFVTSHDAHLATLFVFGIMFAQQFATFWEKHLNLLLFMVLFFGVIFTFTLFDYMEFKSSYTLMGLGTSLFLIIYSLKETPYRPLIGFWYFIATIMFLSGAYDRLYNTQFEVVFAGVCALLIYLSTLARSKSILFVSSIGLLGYIGHYTMIHFVDSIGWPISLVLVGACFIFLSGMAIRIKKQYM